MCQRRNNSRFINIVAGLVLAGVTILLYSKSLIWAYSNGYPPGNLTETEKLSSTPVSDTRTPSKAAKRKFHVALTASKSAYSRWQSRLAYYTYKKVKDMPESDMGDFTRILHAGEADNLMSEIPTFVVDKLPDDGDRNYAPLNRPWAFMQWLDLVSIDEEYILMIEPDHIFVKPIPNLAFGDVPVAYKFFYMKPREEEAVLRRYYPIANGPITDIYPIGSSPVIIKKHLLKRLASTWMTLTMRMKDDPECDERLGWILDMYAYGTAAALHGVRHIIKADFMVQPPNDTMMGDAYMIHYCFGMEYSSQGKLVEPGSFGDWRFDKRTYMDRAPPKDLYMPPRGAPETVVSLIKMLNEASQTLPRWDQIGIGPPTT